MPIKKIVHLADIHIRTFRLHDEYKEIFKFLFHSIKKEVEGYERDEIRIVVAGDLVHQKIVISNEQLMLCTWFLRNLEKIAPVIIIAGNHDLLENNKDRVDSITPVVSFLPDLQIHYFMESKCYLDENIVWCPYSIFEENKRPNIQSAREEFGPDKKYIGLYHAALQNARTDIGYEIDHGAGLEIFEGLDFVLLGDIHKRQTFNHNGILIAYPSSLIQQNFGENIAGHGYLLWDVEDKTFTEHDIANPAPYVQVKVTSVDDIDDNKEKFTNL